MKAKRGGLPERTRTPNDGVVPTGANDRAAGGGPARRIGREVSRPPHPYPRPASRPDLLTAAPEAVLERHPGAHADDVLLWEAQAAVKA